MFKLDNSYLKLDSVLFQKIAPTPVSDPKLILFNDKLSLDLGLGPDEDKVPYLSGNQLPEGAEPIAQAYAGHQFGYFTMLGDGRAILLGEHLCDQGRFDIQLKGCGQTVYSRRGDGRAALGPMIREYVISEAMHALGIPTTRSLAVVVTGEEVYRSGEAQPGAILTRVARSHLRIGTFEYVAGLNKEKHRNKLLADLVDYALWRHFPEKRESKNQPLALLEAVIEAQARTVVEWLRVGFIHGVMNTDNITISGETIDYGPCAFMDSFDPLKVYSSIDLQKRYAFSQQPVIMQWNLARLAETFFPLFKTDEEKNKAIELIEGFASKFDRLWLEMMQKKIGRKVTKSKIDELFALMEKGQLDFTNTFAALDKVPYLKEWYDSLVGDPISQSNINPSVIPRNHLVERALHDRKFLHEFLQVLAHPYQDPPSSLFLRPPSPEEVVHQTFCGT